MTISRQDPGATQAHLASRLALTLEMMIVTNKHKTCRNLLIEILSYLPVLYLLSFILCRNLLIEILSYLQLRSSAHQTSLHGSHGPLQRNKQFQFDNWMRILIWDDPDLLFVTNITNYICGEKLSCGEISAFFTEFEKIMEFYRSLCCFCSKSMWRQICAEKICVE